MGFLYRVISKDSSRHDGGNSQGASQLGGSLLGSPPGYKANKLNRIICLTKGLVYVLERDKKIISQ